MAWLGARWQQDTGLTLLWHPIAAYWMRWALINDIDTADTVYCSYSKIINYMITLGDIWISPVMSGLSLSVSLSLSPFLAECNTASAMVSMTGPPQLRKKARPRQEMQSVNKRPAAS